MSKDGVNQSWADYLRQAMLDAGYDPDGERSGGRTQLAKDAGVSLAAISRTLNEGRTPGPATLKALSGPLRKPFRELLIAAGHATEDDLPVSADDRPVGRARHGGPDLPLDGLTDEQLATLRSIAEAYHAANPKAQP